MLQRQLWTVAVGERMTARGGTFGKLWSSRRRSPRSLTRILTPDDVERLVINRARVWRGTLSDVIIRRAVAADAEALASFGARLFAATYADDTPAAELATYLAEHFGPELQRAEILDPSGCVFVAMEASDQMVGYAHAIKDGDAMLLNRLYLERRARGTGLAARFLNAIETQCRGLGLEKLRLSVFDKNARAIAFYRRAGFATVGTASFRMGEEVQAGPDHGEVGGTSLRGGAASSASRLLR